MHTTDCVPQTMPGVEAWTRQEVERFTRTLVHSLEGLAKEYDPNGTAHSQLSSSNQICEYAQEFDLVVPPSIAPAGT